MPSFLQSCNFDSLFVTCVDMDVLSADVIEWDSCLCPLSTGQWTQTAVPSKDVFQSTNK